MLLCLSPECLSQKPKIAVEKGKGGEYNIKLGDAEEAAAEPEQSKDDDEPPSCEVVRGCTWHRMGETVDKVVLELEQKIFSRSDEAIEQLEDIYYGEKVRDLDDINFNDHAIQGVH